MSAWDDGPPRSTFVGNADTAAFGDLSIGCFVHVRTVLGEDIQGELFAYDSKFNCVCIQEQSEDGKVTGVRVLKANFIKDVVEATERNPGKEVDPLPTLDMAKCRAREAKALKAAEEEAANIGVGVTEQAQEIFDALAKTLPCKWNGTRMIVLDEVTIVEPYGSDNCSGGNSMLLQRVRKVLDGVKDKLSK
mmetsp:Transcript_13978/g.16888  ORF Transcript_13978/g.16888 Transcript_13978/m.16888 type:complete len:191 (-) Transcript_13978:410-982(-)|eukprot:CAMPEP_0197849816 /NCGR_PEP_ID=MMETSP1438-20131217/13304_1 /TAXON_ID=1461541 /ORGANISM="Pterosperma sp., Strain CCMP1384" /LENGTH=190 /DNA_ID=CAMNT_0043462665 /DNA_START=172 /DNA_END=744 /DNA_ORIENTATION=-